MKVEIFDYYYQDSKFHFYKQKIFRSGEKEMLAVNNVVAILGHSWQGQFIFIDDSTFYFVDRFNVMATGPFAIEGVTSGGFSVYDYRHEYSPFEKYILMVGNSKALFIPDSSLVISNYDKYENELINSFFKNRGEATERSNKGKIIYLAILAMTFILIVWMFWRQKR